MKYCDYGCGNEANYEFQNGKMCCSTHYLKCEANKKKVGGKNNPFYGKKHTDETKKKSGEKNKGKIPWNKGVPRTEKEKHNISIRTKEEMAKPQNKKKLLESRPNFKKERHPRWKGGYYSKGIPLFETYASQILYAEKCRRSKKDRNILEVRCTYCGDWYIPAITQVYERIRSLSGTNYGEQRFYCSNECKQACSIFHQILYPKDYKSATSREVQPQLRQMRFQIDNYTCLKCKKHKDELDVSIHCHHIEGIRWEPLESADVDKCMTVCETCHKEIHKKEGCTYNDMQCK